jgi:hypothetical protein
MSETVSSGGTTESGTTDSGTSTGTESTSEGKTTEWYEAELAKVRQEAANNRVKGNEKANATRAEVTAEFEAKLAESNSAHETAKTQAEKFQHNFTKYETALTTVLGEEAAKKVVSFARALQGKDEAELKAHAEELKGLFGLTGQKNDPATDPSQGHGGGNAGAEGDNFHAYVMGLLNNQ